MRVLQRILCGSLLAVAAFWSGAAGALTVSIQPIQICDNGGLNCGNAAQTLFEAEGDKIWAQAGINLTFLPWATLNNSAWADITIGNAAVINAEAQAVMTAGDAITGANTVPMFFAPVLDSDPGLFGLGCGGPVFAAFCNNQVGVFIADNVFAYNGGIGRLDTIAHELGHVLNLQHRNIANELMASGNVRTIPGSINNIFPDGLAVDRLTAADITEALQSPFVLADVPEPATLALLALGLLGVGWRRRALT